MTDKQKPHIQIPNTPVQVIHIAKPTKTLTPNLGHLNKLAILGFALLKHSNSTLFDFNHGFSFTQVLQN